MSCKRCVGATKHAVSPSRFLSYPCHVHGFQWKISVSIRCIFRHLVLRISMNTYSYLFQTILNLFRFKISSFFFYLLSFENSRTRMIPRLCDSSKWPMNIWQETDRNSINRGALLETRIVIDAVLSWQIFQIHVSLLFRFSKKWLHKRWLNMKKRAIFSNCFEMFNFEFCSSFFHQWINRDLIETNWWSKLTIWKDQSNGL